MHIDGNINKILSYDNEHLRQIIKGASFDVLQMNPGQFEAQLFNLSLLDNALDGGFYRKKTLTVGTFAPDVVTFGLIHGLDNYGTINGRDVTELDLTVAVDGSEMECYFHEDTHWSTYQISLEDIRRAGLSLDDRVTRSYRMSAGEHRHLVDVTRNTLALVDRVNSETLSASHLKMVNNFLISSYTNTILKDKDETIDSRKSLELSRKILKYIQANATRTIQTIDLTSAIGKSERTLERIFKKHFNTTIVTFIKRHRLHLAREMLFAADSAKTTVTEVALDCGFFNPNYFSSEYRKFFLETPSETLFK